MGDHLFLTAHGSILCVDEHGNLDHRYFQGAPSNLRFRDDGQILSAEGGVPPQLRSVVARPEGKVFALQSNGNFLSAGEGGGFRWVSYVSGWEQFRLISSDILQKWQAAEAPSFPRYPRRYTIDRILHQTYPPGVPHGMLECAARLGLANRDWEQRFYSDKDCFDFIYAHYGWDILQCYLKIHPSYGAARADFFRYLCLYKHGGVYLDVKSSCERPLTEIVDPLDEYLLCQWNNGPDSPHRMWGIWHELLDVPGGEYQQWNIAAAAGHPFLEAVIEAMLKNIVGYDPDLFGTGREGTLRLTGPIMYTRAIAPILNRHKHRFMEKGRSPYVYDSVEPGVVFARPHYSKLTTPLVL